jgi:hypothetical protein
MTVYCHNDRKLSIRFVRPPVCPALAAGYNNLTAKKYAQEAQLKRLTMVLAGCVMGTAAIAATNSPVTFNKDVLPILQKNCQECHRPGEVAPMSLMTYTDARPWARAMKAALLTQKMPPWFADPKYGHFANDRRLSQKDIDTLVAWVDSGAAEGDAKDKPPAREFPSGWRIKPDMIISMPEAFHLPATGTINYQYIRVKGNITKDLWVKAAEMRPGNPKVVHHGKVWVLPPGSRWMADSMPGKPYEGKETGKNDQMDGNDILGKFNPGLGPQRFDIDGAAKLIPKGSDFVFELHYTASGQPTEDISRVGLVLAKEPPKIRYYLSPGTPAALNMVIPPGDSNAEVVAESTVGVNAKLVYIQPHMHLRGKDYELRLIYPTGETQTVFKGTWNFDWQLGYDLAEPIVVPKGTRLLTIVHYDNSANNKWNPDPAKEVHWGPQNWDEMQSSFLGFLIDVHTDLSKVLKASGPSLLPRGTSGPTLASAEGIGNK